VERIAGRRRYDAPVSRAPVLRFSLRGFETSSGLSVFPGPREATCDRQRCPVDEQTTASVRMIAQRIYSVWILQPYSAEEFTRGAMQLSSPGAEQLSEKSSSLSDPDTQHRLTSATRLAASNINELTSGVSSSRRVSIAAPGMPPHAPSAGRTSFRCFETVPQCFQAQTEKLVRNRDACGGYYRRFCSWCGDQRPAFAPSSASSLRESQCMARGAHVLLCFGAPEPSEYRGMSDLSVERSAPCTVQ